MPYICCVFIFIHLKVFSNFICDFPFDLWLKIVLLNFHVCEFFQFSFYHWFLVSFHCRLEKMFTHYFLYFPSSAGISVGLGWNHHHLPLPSYWILCPEVWKGNLSLSSFVTTVPLLLYGQVSQITFAATSVLPCWPFTFHLKLHLMACTRQATWSGIKLETRPRRRAKSRSCLRVVFCIDKVWNWCSKQSGVSRFYIPKSDLLPLKSLLTA